MKAILVKEKGNAEKLSVSEYPKPEAKRGYVLVANKAFGINRAEVYMRKGEFGETHDIIGIECAGVVESDPSGTFARGQKVISFVGGLARDFGGGYAEFVSLPLANVIPVETNLPWDELAAIPETFSSAWGTLHWGLEVNAGESILVRGGTSTLGLAIIILAKQMGLTVIATSRSEEKLYILKNYGADYAVVDNGSVSEIVRQIFPKGVNNVAELVGTKSLIDSLAATAAKGSVCVIGFLGSLTPLENFMPLIQIPSSVKLTSFGSAFVVGNENFPFAEIPMQKIINDIEEEKIPNILAKT
ncbi:MAG TPA: zinc-binding dehydrogenase, partial [Puia sp.]|nr:zinc-binding dehydrogenase [Puia sp.]